MSTPMSGINPEIIQQILAPAAMIPACGLLLLSSTARMNTVLARIRAFHAERLDVWRSNAETGTRDDSVRSLRLEGLEHQTHQLLSRAALLRWTMLQLFGAVACNLLSIVGLALLYLTNHQDAFYTASVMVFVTGIVLVLGSMATSALEVKRILETVRYEHARVECLCDASSAEFVAPVGPRPAGGEGSGL